MMEIKLDYGAFPPERAHSTDAGLDLRSPDDYLIGQMASVCIPTGVHIKLPPGTYGRIASKSGLMTKYGIVTDGTIDEGYTGQIVVWLHNTGMKPYSIERGDKIAQLIVQPCLYEPVELVDDLGDETERGENGFGSTGR